MQQLTTDTLLHGGTYKIVKLLGQGSFGITYLAEHTSLGKKVAIKEFFMKELNSRSDNGSITGLTDGSLSYNYAQKFRKEAQNLSRLDHPNIVRVTNSFEENGTFYYVMEYIDGLNLNDYVKQQAISEEEAISIIKDVANALIYMHEEKHMLHLDLKPGNIMRRNSDGHVFLIDFGLSKHFDDNGTPETSTTIGLGTAGYAPIEQGNRAKDGEFRPTIDVYALGATLFKLLTNETPPPASDLLNDDELMENKLRVNGITSRTIGVITNAMQPGVKKRIPSIRKFIDCLSQDIDSSFSIDGSDSSSEETLVIVPSGTKKKSESSQTVNRDVGKQGLNLHKGKVTDLNRKEESSGVQETSSNKVWWLVWIFLTVSVVVYIVNSNDFDQSQSPIESSNSRTIDKYVSPSENTVTRTDIQEDNHDQEIIDFIHFFYSAYVFGNYDFDNSKVSASVLKRLRDDYEYDGEGIAVWDFRTEFQDGPSDESQVTSVTPEGNGWYKVTMLDMGNNGTKRVKVSYNNGSMQIVDFK